MNSFMFWLIGMVIIAIVAGNALLWWWLHWKFKQKLNIERPPNSLYQITQDAWDWKHKLEKKP